MTKEGTGRVSGLRAQRIEPSGFSLRKTLSLARRFYETPIKSISSSPVPTFIGKTIDLLWDAVAAVVAHSTSVPQTYPPRPQHAHSSPARVHSTTGPRLRTTLLSCCGPCLNTWWSVYNLKTILLLAKHGNDNVDKGGDIHGIRE